VKQCPSCAHNLADFVEFCPYCAAATASVRGPLIPQALSTGAPAVGRPENSGKALASLICGLAFFFWPLAPIGAVLLGHLALAEIKRSAGRLTGRGMAIGGLVAGYLGMSVFPILIILAIAIPNLLRSRMVANEASAAGTLRTYNLALVRYAEQCPQQGYPATLASLGPAPSGGDRCAHASLVDPLLGQEMPVKSGYRFFYTPESYDRAGRVVKYGLGADPVTPNVTGTRHFFTDQSGVIRVSVQGGADVDSQPLP